MKGMSDQQSVKRGEERGTRDEKNAEKAGAAGIALIELMPEPIVLHDIVLLFLALLELLKLGIVEVMQEEFCGDIRVFFVPEGQRDRGGAA